MAWEWCNDIVMPADWNSIKILFCRYFSIQGRPVKHLHERWIHFKFDLSIDEVFISYVNQTVDQLNHNYMTALILIKVCVPADIYGASYSVQKLDMVVAMVKDIDSEKPS